MNAEQMSAALKAFGTLMGGSEAVALAKFSQVFNGMGEAKATAIAAQVGKNWKAERRVAKRPADLAQAVRRIESTLAAMGAKAQAGVFSKVLVLLTGTEHQDVDSFVSDAIAARIKKAPPPKPPKAAKPKFADLAPELAQRLAAVAHDRGRFDALLNNYECLYKAAQLKVIAKNLRGSPINKKEKDIIKAMRNWQREEELNSYSHASQEKVPL